MNFQMEDTAMKRTNIKLPWLVFVLAIFLLSVAPSTGSAQQQAPTPTPDYISSNLIIDETADFPLCWSGYISAGMVPCGSPPGTTPQHIDIVWPTTARVIEFSTQADTWLALEVNRVIDDKYPGSLGVDLQYFDGNCNCWAGPLSYYAHIPTTGTTTKNGVLEGKPIDPDWMNKFTYNDRWTPIGANKYRIRIWSEVRTFNGAVVGYIPSKGTVKLYSLDNFPPPTPTPAPTLTPSPIGTVSLATTPTSTLTPSSEQKQISINVEQENYEPRSFNFSSTEPISELTIEGHVVDEKGVGIENAAVTLLQPFWMVYTGRDGWFRMSVQVQDQGKPLVISQNFELSYIPRFTAEILEKDANGKPYTGLVADGVSYLTIQANMNAGASPNRIGVKCLMSGASFMLEENPCSNLSMQGNTMQVIVTPMERFPGPYTIEVKLTYHGDDGGEYYTESLHINVIHPPVVLIHGIWSGRGAMIPLRTFLNNTGDFSYLVTADYSTTSYGEIRNNVGALQNAVNAAFQQLEVNGYRGQRVDIVAHSMGGLISRLYMLGYTAPDGSAVPGQAQKVRKLITLSTPHLGSPLGDWYTELDPPNMFYCPPYGLGLIKEGTHEPYKDEYEHVLNYIRSEKGLRSDALTYGEGARQLATLKNPVLDELNARQRLVHNQDNEFYFLAGEKAFFSETEGDYKALLGPKDIYPYHPAIENTPHPPVEAKVGPCGQTEMPESFRSMVADFITYTSANNSDGVVDVNSSLGSNTGISPVVAKTVPFDHFSITEAGSVWKDVYTYLIGSPPGLTGSYFFKGSPGTLNVYDEQGRAVGPDEISIPGATYEEFEDVTGGHTLIYVPEGGQFTVKVDTADAGKVTLEVNQGGADGWRWTRYEDIAVEPGSHVELKYDRDNPQGQVIHANGETISLVPTYHEIISDVPADAEEDILAGMGNGLQSLWFIGFLVVVCMLGLGAIFILWLVLHNRGQPQPVAIYTGDQYQRAQVPQGQSWYQDPNTGGWSFWNGQAWQPIPGAPPIVYAPQQGFAKKQSGWGSCLFSLFISGGIGLIVGGGISLVVFNFFPSIQIELGPGDLTQTLAMGGGGLLATILGLILLNSGFKAILTRRAIVVDERHRRHEQHGCGAIVNGLGQLFFGIVCLASGVGLMTLAFYQAILPWLVF
jgi:pimeloyl-ACP methyl ester carboxylesterase